MSIYEKSYVLNDDILVSNLKKNINNMHFSFEEIFKMMQMFEPKSSGFFGSIVLNTLLSKYGEEIKNINDIDFCVTTLNNFEYIKSYFQNNKDFLIEQIDNFNYYHNFKNIKNIFNVYSSNPENKHYLQIVYADVDNIETFLQNVDFNITKSAFTTCGFITYDSVLKDISTKKTHFPKTFDNISSLRNGLNRMMKYKNRGINFIFPKQISWNSTEYDEFDDIDKYILFPIYKFVTAGILSKKITKKSIKIEKLKKKLNAKIKESHELINRNVYLENKIDMIGGDYEDLKNNNNYLLNKINNFKTKIQDIISATSPESSMSQKQTNGIINFGW